MDKNTAPSNPQEGALEGDPRWLLVQRIVASGGFAGSQRLSAFLLYVSRRALTGDAASLSERVIGEAVFQRPADYDPRDDNIVRSHASRLRDRLEAYFAEEGAGEPWRVVVPRGSYVPVFEEREADPAEHVPETVALEPEVHDPAMGGGRAGQKLWQKGWARGLVAVGLLCVLGAGVFLYQRIEKQRTPTHKLWSQLFSQDRKTLIVPADSSLVIARLMTGHQVRLSDYAGGRYRQATGCDKPCDLRMVDTIEALRYTSMSDLEFAVRVTHLPEARGDRIEIRFARDLELKDLKESNLILAGSQEADPWMSIISGQMNFVMHDDPSAGALRVENRRPQKGELSEYPYDYRNPEHKGLATVAYIPNLSGNGDMLVVEGFSVAGTQAAAEFATSGKDLDTLLGAYGGNDSKLPHFEVLLSTVEINGMASRAVPLAVHILP